VNDAMAGFLIEGVDFDASSIRIDRNYDETHGDSPLVPRFQEMSGRDGVFAYFEIHLAGTLPRIKQRSGIDRLGASQDGFLLENQRAMNNFVANNGKNGQANLHEGGGKFANESGGGERVSGNPGSRKNQKSKKQR
jgi:hypothetical protein